MVGNDMVGNVEVFQEAKHDEVGAKLAWTSKRPMSVRRTHVHDRPSAAAICAPRAVAMNIIHGESEVGSA